LKEQFPGATVVGIDANRAAAGVAATRLDRVICARLDDLDFGAHGLAEHEFDTVIVADILEHLVNPWRVLERLRPLLAPQGQLLASIPNVRNLALVSDLLQAGRWSYDIAGLLDITHLRFFTLFEIERMFEETGYRAEKHGAIIFRSLRETYQKNHELQSGTIQVGRMTLSGVSPGELLELCTEQFLFRCRRAETSAPAR
jgi:2-polyprenyl-3-methyl-5-hydroxy-6-metoxy-1,4-benzoquinol methylase